MPESQLLHVASEVYPRGRSSEWHQACMDIAAQYCTARSPRCLFCPVTKACRSAFRLAEAVPPRISEPSHRGKPNRIWRCLLYTSDAADEEDSVDLGGRRIIKK